MGKKVIVHVSEVDISLSSGMGRVEYYWKAALENRGYEFIHIGSSEVGPMKHQGLFPRKAWKYYKQLNIRPDALIVHEPAGGYFTNLGIPCFLESHGIERRNWENQLNGLIPLGIRISSRTKLLFPLWRLRGCDQGLRKADKLLLINSEDRDYAMKKYNRSKDDIFVFRNGVNSQEKEIYPVQEGKFTVLFNGTWIERKGTKLLVKAAEMLRDKGYSPQYLLIGSGKDENDVMNDWPADLRPQVQVVSRFKPEEEASFLAKASVFVLPSYFEGQPLSLLQAMSAGKCSITSNCCGQKDIVEHGRTGLLFEPGNAEQLASLIESAIKDRSMAETLGANARQMVSQRSWSSVSDEVATYIINNIRQ